MMAAAFAASGGVGGDLGLGVVGMARRSPRPPWSRASGRGAAPERPNAKDLLASPGRAPASSRRIYAETLYPRLHLGWSELASLTDGRWHYIEAPRPEIYDKPT